ncbi:MAG: 30S ribosomal protein S16 [Candidatus Microgenomates bacterium]
MAVAIRLYRIGKKDQPSYRIVAVNKRYKANGKYIEEIGFYNPLKNPPEINIKNDRLNYWLEKGAIISEGLEKVLKYKKSVDKKITSKNS